MLQVKSLRFLGDAETLVRYILLQFRGKLQPNYYVHSPVYLAAKHELLSDVSS